MAGEDNVLLSFIAVLISVGVAVLLVLQITKSNNQQPSQPSNSTVKKTFFSFPSWRPLPTNLSCHRNSPFCEHTSNGCYPGTQTPCP